MTPPLPHPRHLYEPFLKEPISSVKGIIISMKDIKISIVSCLQTISLSTLGSMYPGHDLPKKALCGGALHSERDKQQKPFFSSSQRQQGNNLSSQQWALFPHSTDQSL